MATVPPPDFTDLAEGLISTITLDRLMLSKLNVRQTERAADVDSLAEDIAARGLKQNLVVVPAHFTSGEARSTSEGGQGWEGMFEVIAGGRRFQALQLLVEQERLSATFPVPCMIEYRDAAAETSLSENLHRVAMNPADEFEAFRIIVDQARKSGVAEDPIAYCAKRFGATVKHVQGRLRLASLAPEILEALRTDAISVDSAKAYAGVEDHELQLKVFEGQKKANYRPHHADQVRQALQGATLPLTDARITFVSLDAYVAAGGRTEIDLFMGVAAEERISDVKLLEKLAHDQGCTMLEAAAKADGFKSGVLAKGVGAYVTIPKAPDGMEQVLSWNTKPTKAQRKKCVGVYSIASDGLGLKEISLYRPTVKQAEEPAKPQRDWAAERAASLREDVIEARAGQIALPTFQGTPFENLISWPDPNLEMAAFPCDDIEGHTYIVAYFRVPTTEIEANKAEAERVIDEEAAAAEPGEQEA